MQLFITVSSGETATIENLPANTTYEVEELTKDGWVTVKEENSTGTIAANKTSKAIFTNHYDPTKTNAKIFATALLDNKPTAGFSFDLYKDGSKIDSTTSLYDGTVTFSSLTFDRPGVYTYQIKASNTTNSNYQYDSSTKTITVNVTDTNGVLFADVDSKPTFNNVTKQGTLTVQKVVKGGSQSNQLFTFALTADDKTQTFKLHAGEQKIFSLPYGTEYELKETDLPAGYTQDSFTNSTGTIDSNNSSITAVSTSTSQVKGSFQIIAKTILNNKKLQAGEFSFELKDKKTGAILSRATNDENGNITFDTQNYTQAGSYNYEISEVIPQDKDLDTTYDTEIKQVTVTVTDTEDGKLKAVADTVPLFTNIYNWKSLSFLLQELWE